MLYLIDGDEIHYKTVNRMIHEKVYYKLTIVERNAINECLVRLHDILSKIRLSSANEVFYYITDGNMLVGSFFRGLSHINKINQAQVKVGKKKIEVFGELMEEEFITKQLSYLPMDDNLAENEAFKIVKDVFEYHKIE